MGELRIIAGTWRGRRIRTGRFGEAGTLRPTSDRVRTSLFDRLAPDLPGARVLDLFAGTGALGIEALSRGAAHVTFVEQAPRVLRVLKGNLEVLGARETVVRNDDVFRALVALRRTGESFDLILADPPYQSGLAARLVAALDAGSSVRPGGLVVVEHDRRELLPAVSGALEPVEERKYGDTLLTFYRGR